MLTIDPDKVCYIIVKAREFDAKVDPPLADPGSNPGDDGSGIVLGDYPSDPTLQELMTALRDLPEDESVEVVALTWLGRGTFSTDEWDACLEEARSAHNNRTAEYLTGIPLLSDYLEEGLAQLGYDCEDFEMGRM